MGWKSVKRMLIRIARAVVQNVMSQVTQQVNIVENEVKATLRSYVQEVVGGVWTGKGADAFVATLQEEAVPMSDTLMDEITQINTNITTALDIMDQAEAAVQNMVNSLEDTFSAI